VALVYLPLVWRRQAGVMSWLAVPLFACALWALQARTVVPFLYFQF
jgi:hypothetical protein